MLVLQLPISYFFWHYTTAWGDLLRLYRNFSWFLWHFFSIRILLGTLFSPWHRLHEGKSKETAGFLGSFIINFILRFIGFFARTATILLGLVTMCLFSVASLAFFALWPFLPLLALWCVVQGITGLANVRPL